MDDRRYRFDPTTARAAGRLGAILVAGLAAALAALCLVIDAAAVDTDKGLIAAGGAAVVALLAWVLPWHRLGRLSLIVLPVLTAGGLVGLDELTDLSLAPESRAFYPTAWFVILTWIGLTQPRWMTVLSAPLVAAVALALTLPDGSKIPVEAVAVTLPAAVIIGEAMAWALAGIRQGQRIERRREADIRTLATSVSVLRAGKTTLEDIADVLARLAHEVFHGDHVTVVLHGQDGRLVPVSLGAAHSAPSEQTGALVAQAIADAEVRLVAENGTTLLIIPLIGETEIGGAVVVRQPKTGDDPFTQQLAVLFASQAGPALEQIRIISQLSEDLRRDEKTGIGNDRHARYLVQSLTPGDAVVYIDLDHFSDINEKFGHDGGDRVLREFGDLLRNSVRDSDLVSRLGGDEFILVARAAEFDALPAANRLLQAWRDKGERYSFSAGVAIHDQNDLPEQSLKNADVALYRAKGSGRNRVCLYPKGGWLGDTMPRNDPPDDDPLANMLRRPPDDDAPSGVTAKLPDDDPPPTLAAAKNLDFLPSRRKGDDWSA